MAEVPRTAVSWRFGHKSTMKNGLGAKKKNPISMPSTSVLATTVVAQVISLANDLLLPNPHPLDFYLAGIRVKARAKGAKVSMAKVAKVNMARLQAHQSIAAPVAIMATFQKPAL